MRRFFALVALTALCACGNEIDQSTRPDNVAGTYQLLSWGGVPLPATLQADAVNVQVTKGELILGSDGTWSEVLTLQVATSGGSQPQEVSSFGNWNNIRQFAYISFFDRQNNYQFSGTAAGGTVILTTVNGDQLVYRR
jgi:hypothetical protein